MTGRSQPQNFDVVLAGAGLANCLVALALLEHHPGVSIALIERGRSIGGNHLWSFHQEDLPEAFASIASSLATASWPKYEVVFSNLRRTVDDCYTCLTSEKLHQVVCQRFENASRSVLFTNSDIDQITSNAVFLKNGMSIQGSIVLDGRGPERVTTQGGCGWQKFVGIELDLSEPSPVQFPILMDGTVEQTDGFRFFYVLPLSSHRVMIEDTYYSDSPLLDVEKIRAGIVNYAQNKGFSIAGIHREEIGSLPLPLVNPTNTSASSPMKVGYGGGLFHPTTGYSFPVAARVALHFAEHWPNNVFGKELQQLLDEHAEQCDFASMLNRLMFKATPPQHRVDVMERFYGLNEATIRRFYSLKTTTMDRAKIMIGRPPKGVSIRQALLEVFSA